VESVEECADRIGRLLSDTERAREMGAAGRETVRDEFLITRYLHDYISMMHEVAGARAGR
jgi:trehalose synthase